MKKNRWILNEMEHEKRRRTERIILTCLLTGAENELLDHKLFIGHITMLSLVCWLLTVDLIEFVASRGQYKMWIFFGLKYENIKTEPETIRRRRRKNPRVFKALLFRFFFLSFYFVLFLLHPSPCYLYSMPFCTLFIKRENIRRT